MTAESQPMSMSEAAVERDPDEARTFSAFLSRVEDGEFAVELSDHVRDIVATLHDVQRDVGGKPSATITITLGFKLEDGMVEVRADAKVKKPKVVRPRSMFWASPNNNLTGRNPKQRELPLRQVLADAAEVRRV